MVTADSADIDVAGEPSHRRARPRMTRSTEQTRHTCRPPINLLMFSDTMDDARCVTQVIPNADHQNALPNTRNTPHQVPPHFSRSHPPFLLRTLLPREAPHAHGAVAIYPQAHTSEASPSPSPLQPSSFPGFITQGSRTPPPACPIVPLPQAASWRKEAELCHC